MFAEAAASWATRRNRAEVGNLVGAQEDKMCNYEATGMADVNCKARGLPRALTSPNTWALISWFTRENAELKEK